MNEIADKLEKVLLTKYQAVNSDDKTVLNKTLVSAHARAYDADLLALLQSDEEIKNHFFVQVKKVSIFKLENFLTFINNRAFLPDSYTAFKNKIGLATDKDNYLTNNRDVVLNWPYKDCVLEGGQTKEDQKRSEVLFNEVLAPDQINRLLDDKVFTNFKRFDKDGEHEVTELKKNDNLIIKGNNLVVLHSLKKRFAGKVKLIYIDPPFNTGSDSFGYNDKFNHSSWLTFMKNRLDVAKELLSDVGMICVHIGNEESAYLQLLLDEIFGRENYLNHITMTTNAPSGFKATGEKIFSTANHLFLYSKNYGMANLNKLYIGKEYDSSYNLVLLNPQDNHLHWKWKSIKEVVAETLGFADVRSAAKKLKQTFDEEISQYAIKNANRVFQTAAISGGAAIKRRDTIEKSMSERDKVFVHPNDDVDNFYILNGRQIIFYNNRLIEIDGHIVPGEMLTDIWTDIQWNGIANEGGVTLKNGKKPEALAKRILEMCTKENDLVMDFYAGSGTLGAVAHKTGRRYVLVEQLEYIHELPERRLINVINGDTTGISKSVNWQGGGSFVYCELANDAEKFKTEVRNAKQKDLPKLLAKAKESSFLSYRVDREKFNGFEELTEAEQRALLLELVDANTLYINYTDIESADYEISVADKKLNKEFYGE